MAGLYLTVHKGCLMCNQTADVVMGLFWLIQLDQLILRETPPDTDDHAHRSHLEVASIATANPVQVTYSNNTQAQASKGGMATQQQHSCSSSGLSNCITQLPEL